jgi:hypothetical protein
VLGLPIRATVSVLGREATDIRSSAIAEARAPPFRHCLRTKLNLDASCLAFADAEPISTDLELNRIAKRRNTGDTYFCAWRQAHFHKAARDLIRASHFSHLRGSANRQLSERAQPAAPIRTSTRQPS